MAYTVKKISELSGVTIRTLHFYEEIGLLKPAYHGSGGYRYYEEKELLQLQQILFFKELGFTLKQIQKILGRSDFDQLAALRSHKRVLLQDVERLQKLVNTIDETINHLEGIKKMNEEEMYGGFITKEKQREYKKYWEDRLGENHPSLVESNKNVEKWKKEDWDSYKKEADLIFSELGSLCDKKVSPQSDKVEAMIAKLYTWVKRIWTPDKASFINLGQMYTGFEWKSFFETYDPHHPQLALFISEGMKHYAENHL